MHNLQSLLPLIIKGLSDNNNEGSVFVIDGKSYFLDDESKKKLYSIRKILKFHDLIFNTAKMQSKYKKLEKLPWGAWDISEVEKKELYKSFAKNFPEISYEKACRIMKALNRFSDAFSELKDILYSQDKEAV